MEKKYWKGVEELRNDAEFVRLKNDEFYEPLPIDELINKKAEDITVTPRRDFLKFLGFSVAAASLAACEAPVRKTIPYVIRPEQITPGIANYYASTYFDGYDYASLVVKTREGRPIKVEGNTLSSISKGRINARVQASVLSLYDNVRLRGPLMSGNAASWADVDKAIGEKLTAIAAKGGKIRILSSTVISPSTLRVIGDFSKKYPTTKHIQYDAISLSAMRQSNLDSFGVNGIPSYMFNKANVIVGIESDFLVNWISPIEYAAQYAETRKLDGGKKAMSRHIQLEAAMSVTGSNADVRIGVKPSQQGSAVVALYNAIASKSGASAISGGIEGELAVKIEKAAEELLANKGKSLVVCGINDIATQNIVNAINVMLDSYGNTIDLTTTCNLRQGNDAELAAFTDEMNKGEVSALLVYNCNPAYTLPDAKAFTDGMKRTELTVSFSDRPDETSLLCQFVCPDHHSLESWNDAEPKKGFYSISQPTISPLFNTRQFQETLLAWAGTPTLFHDYMKAGWSSMLPVGLSWEKFLQDGVLENTGTAAGKFTSSASLTAPAGGEKAGFELVIYEKVGLGNGLQANNPWLQELPDPISKITWDNYLAVSPKDAREKGWAQGNIVSIKSGNVSAKVPVVIQPGQTAGTVSLAVGYGRTAAGKTADKIGVNAYPFVTISGNSLRYSAPVEISKTVDEDYLFAATQTHHTMMGRAIVKETTLEEFIKNPNAGNEPELLEIKAGKDIKKERTENVTLWTEHEIGNHHWGLSIDLNSCIGCGACVVACTAENNVSVVGKDEVRRSREMHWMRIDRYYSSDADPKEHQSGDNALMEIPSDMPKVVYQPVMCQHCNHAPCETVCPVIATSHSSEGLNQMTYNRCVGTRYCANNCPFKVRRFNWFQYSDNKDFDFNTNNDLGKMVLNPDVVVRSRGVMEKCSMCVQRIQEGKLNAKKEGRQVKEGEVNTACAQTCPTQAITFGDYNRKDSAINTMWKPEERSYHLLGELNVQPNVFYQTKVRNVEEVAEVHTKGAEKHS